MAKTLKVFLLPIDSNPARMVFYSETAEEEGEGNVDAGHGLRGWAERRLRRLKGLWQHSQGGAVRLSRHAWEWLQRHTHPDEILLARLRKASLVELHHPASMTSDEVVASWSAFLAGGRRRHWPWFLVDLLVAPVTVVLAPLPGPNLIGYWFAYRAVHHWLILAGLRKARAGRVETSFRPTDALDAQVHAAEPSLDPGQETAHLEALGCNREALHAFLERHGKAWASPPRNEDCKVADDG
jgi:Mitochondrial K+-H+ exchange-related